MNDTCLINKKFMIISTIHLSTVQLNIFVQIVFES